MKPEVFFEAFTELDDDLIKNAFSKTQEPEIVRPAERVFSWKPLATAAALVFLAGGITVGGMKLYNSRKVLTEPVDSVLDSSGSQESSVSSKITQNVPVSYSYMLIDYEVYKSAWELVANSDIVATAKVTGISFEASNFHTGESPSEISDDIMLYTIYDVEVTASYKGTPPEKLKIIVRGGLEDYEVDKQLELLGEKSTRGIPVLNDPLEINIGDEYLFVLTQSSTDDTRTSLVNLSQGVFPLNDPTFKERFAQASLDEIIAYLTDTDDYFEGVSIIHNGQRTMLFDEDSELALTVMGITNNCGAIENRSDTVLSEQQIAEYGKNGYIVTVNFGSHNGLQMEKGSDEKVRIIYKATVLIGKDGDASYITYSYVEYSADGTSEQHSGVFFDLSENHREWLLEALNSQDLPSDNLSVIHNDQPVALSEQSSAALTDTVMQLLTTGGLPEVQSTITEQDIKEYGKNGYAIMIRDYDIDEPLFEGAYDKKARVISDVTVLIGGEDEPSYLTYSYTVFSTDGASENYNGGTFALNESSRDNILQILNP